MEPKAFRSYHEQVGLLRDRGMFIADEERAVEALRLVNYYRLSGYWYSFRETGDGKRSDRFLPGSDLDDVLALYRFDERLRTTVFDALAPLELSIRAALGHALGRLDPCAHLRPDLLGPVARTGDAHRLWQARHQREIDRSREDFVAHHRSEYGGVLPVWAAVEVMDWGSLTRLFAFAPAVVQHEVSDRSGSQRRSCRPGSEHSTSSATPVRTTAVCSTVCTRSGPSSRSPAWTTRWTQRARR